MCPGKGHYFRSGIEVRPLFSSVCVCDANDESVMIGVLYGFWKIIVVQEKFGCIL